MIISVIRDKEKNRFILDIKKAGAVRFFYFRKTINESLFKKSYSILKFQKML